ncbi:LysM domain-containing protein [Geobacillus sp. FJAT-46040]|uniref:LysM peptidoglycan-binding domain-containing protein n=1 Tax=Geobacillus sp. FJAT-46040 TaxID=2011017 RepID=UPI000BB819BD|nr:LysM domain-containing protein [Geobacillus sp. FJAT-46040]
MKKWLLVCIAVLVGYIAYRDLTTGTLPASSEPLIAEEGISSPVYKTVKIKAGDTLLSIAEREQQGPLPVSIDTLIRDFEKLNPGTKANALQIGKAYKIPVYKK